MNINIIGSGNVASHIGKAAVLNKHSVSALYSTNSTTGRRLGKRLGTTFIEDFSSLPIADITVICVPDNAIDNVASSLAAIDFTGLCVHTSGSTPVDALKPLKSRGVIWPLQTFTKGRRLNFQRIPLCIDAVNDRELKVIKDFASSLSDNVQVLKDEEREKAHLAAVFANNFTNHLIYKANEILKQHDLDKDILQPLIKETIAKAKAVNPYHAQTGPARRNDGKTIEKHLSLLDTDQAKEIYQLITESIQNTYKA